MISYIGEGGLVLFINIIFFIVGLLVIFLVISTAVRVGINKSIISKCIEKKCDNQDKRD